MRRLLLISLAAALIAAGVLVFQFMPRGGRRPDTAAPQATAERSVRSIPTRPQESLPPAQAPAGAAKSPDVLGDVSRTLGELRTREAAEDGARPATTPAQTTSAQIAPAQITPAQITPAQVEALRAQAERRHVRPVTRMTFPVEPGTVVPPQVFLHPMPPELAGLSPPDDPLGFIQVGDRFVLVGTVSRRIVAASKG